MNYPREIYKDLLHIKMREELERDIKTAPFIVGALGIASVIVLVSFLML